MKYRRLGNSDLELSEIGFGTADNAGLMVRGDAREQLAAVEFALGAGVNYFETSPSFGKGEAETNLGKVLKQLDARPHIGTMVEILPDGFDDIGAAIESALDGSLRRLGLDGVDVLIVHNPPRKARDLNEPAWQPVTFEDMTGPALAAFERVQRAGKARYFGFATEHCDPEVVIALIETGRFAMINAWYNVVNPSGARLMPRGVRFGREYPDYGRIIERAAANNVGVAAFRILAGGALSDPIVTQGAAGRHAVAGGSYSRNPQAFQPEIDRSRALSFLKTPARSLPQSAYAYVLANPGITTAVAGPSDAAQLRELLSAPAVAALNNAELERVDAVYGNNFGLAAALEVRSPA